MSLDNYLTPEDEYELERERDFDDGDDDRDDDPAYRSNECERLTGGV